jgi:ketosteroid isomerase-like protein
VTAQPLPNAVTAFVETVNAGDTLGFLDSFTPDAVVDDWGRRFTDREAIRAWSDAEFIGAGGRMTVTKSSVDGRTAVVIADWRSTHANGLSRFVFTLAGDKIAQMQISAA